MSASPRVGIVLRTKDRSFFVARAVRDILEQDFESWHLLVVNDGGDRSAVDQVLAEYGEPLAGRATVVDVPAPGGRCLAANTGIRACETEFVVLHDDDDRWATNFLSTTVRWLDDHPDDVGVMVPTEIVYERMKKGGYAETGRSMLFPGMTQVTYLDMLAINRAVPISFLYRAEAHCSVGYYDETLEAVEDWEFYLRLLVDHHVGFIPGPPLAYWYLRPTVKGPMGNSMFALGDVHQRYDAVVRDRALREFVRTYGPGLPLYLAGQIEDLVARQRDLLRQASLLRRLWHRLRQR